MASRSSDENSDAEDTSNSTDSKYFTNQSSMKPKLDAILNDLADKLPSLDDNDSDFSESQMGSEEELEIFQRPVTYSNVLDDEDKDLDESLTDEEFQSQWAASFSDIKLLDDNTPITYTPNFIEPRVQVSASEIVQVSDPEVDNSASAFPEQPDSANTLLNLITTLRSLKDRAAGDNFQISPPVQVPQMRSSRRDRNENNLPRVNLSLGELENVDLDLALQSVIENEHRQTRPRSRSSSFDLFDLKPGDRLHITQENKKQPVDVMKQLVKHSMRHVEEKIDIDPRTGKERRRFGPEGSNDSKYVVDQLGEKTTHSAGASTDQHGLPLRELSARPRDQRFTSAVPSTGSQSDTVFIDLRKSTDDIEKELNTRASIQRVLNLQDDDSLSVSSTDTEGDNEEDWFSQRRKVKEAIARGDTVENIITTKVTQTLPIKHTPPPRVHNIDHLNKTKASPAIEQVTDQSESSTSISESQGQTTSPVREITPTEDELAKKNRMKGIERKLMKEFDEKLRAKMNLKEVFEKNRPQSSAKGNHRTAPATPTLYNMDVSYEAALSPALAQSDLKDSTVLSIHLSSNGEIIPHRPNHAKNIDQDGNWSVSYLALITWLCSLVPEVGNSEWEAPFYVLALQQCYHNGRYMLLVAVKPTSKFNETQTPQRKRNKAEGSGLSLFQSWLNRFLMSHSLLDVNPWLSSLESQPITCMNNRESSFQYKPSLPRASGLNLATFIKIITHEGSAVKYFTAPQSFHWNTIDTDEPANFDDELIDGEGYTDIQNTLVLINRFIYKQPQSLFSIFSRILQNGLDICGLRLATPSNETIDTDEISGVGLVLAVALRGTLARPIWLEELGPADPNLARKTDPNSLNALYGGDNRDTCCLFTPRNPVQITQELSRWFGGRLSDKHLQNQSLIPDLQTTESNIDQLMKIPPVTLLSATIHSEVLLLISPLLSVKYIGVILASCQRRGFHLRGARRRRINEKQASLLGVSTKYSQYFIANHNLTSPRAQHDLLLGAQSTILNCIPQPAFILHLSKENSLHHSASLVENLMVQLTLIGQLDECKEKVDKELCSSHLFQIAAANNSVINALGGDLTKVPELDGPAFTGYIAPKLHYNPELEQVCVLTLIGRHYTTTFSLILARLLNVLPHSHSNQIKPTTDPQGLELLGLKWTPAVNSFQARELTPYEVGHLQWKSSLKQMTSEPAVFLVFRGLNCSHRVKTVLNIPTPLNNKLIKLDMLLSDRIDSTFRLLNVVFYDRELYSHDECREMFDYLPPVRTEVKSHNDTWEDESAQKGRRPRSGRSSKTPPRTPPKTPPLQSAVVEESIFKFMQLGPRPILTLLVIKPSVVIKNSLARLLRSLVQNHYELVGIKMVQLTEFDAMCLQSPKIQNNEELYRQHCTELTRSDSLVLVLSRENAVKHLLQLIGAEDPREARLSDQFSWRGQHGTSLAVNGFYASTSYQRAVSDIRKLFPDGVCSCPTTDTQADNITCPGADNSICSTNRSVIENINMELSGGSQYLSRLLEVNCLILKSDLLKINKSTKQSLYVDVIHALQSSHILLVGANLVWFNEEQAQSYLKLRDAGTFRDVPTLTSRPFIVLAVQCENMILSYDYLMETAFDKIGKDKSLYLPNITAAKSNILAHKMLAFFFQRLSNRSKYQISERDHL